MNLKDFLQDLILSQISSELWLTKMSIHIKHMPILICQALIFNVTDTCVLFSLHHDTLSSEKPQSYGCNSNEACTGPSMMFLNQM